MSRQTVIRDLLIVARRELRERTKSKWFVAMTLLGPIFMVAVIIVPALIAGQGAEGAKVAIVDHTRVIAEPLAAELSGLEWKPEIVAVDTSEDALRARIGDESLNGFVVIPADALDGGKVIYRGDNASSQLVAAQIFQALQKVVQSARGARAKLDSKLLEHVLMPINFSARHTTGEATDSSGMGAFALAYALALLLYMVITVYGVAVMRSVVMEKTSRVMEFLVAAVKPSSLMGGKIMGVAAAGLIQITVWLGMGAVTLAYRDEILGVFGVTGGTGSLPPLAFAEIAIVLGYFMLGFVFYAAMYAAVGAMVSNEEETQQVQLPVTMILVIGVVCLNVISNDPRGTASSVMTQVPFWSPIVMPMRYVLGGATGVEVLISIGILVLSTLLVIRGAAKIFRVGVLMYGKRPGVRELVRWLRY